MVGRMAFRRLYCKYAKRLRKQALRHSAGQSTVFGLSARRPCQILQTASSGFAIRPRVVSLSAGWASPEENEMRAFLDGFMKGARETPRGYFAPAVAIWRLLVTTTDSLLAEKQPPR
jgi:hypothetical protein